MKIQGFPKDVKSGNSTVTIYGYTDKRGYDEYKVGYYSQGKLKLEQFPTLAKAEKRAKEINKSVNAGDTDTLLLTAAERTEYTQAKEFLHPIGVSLAVAAMNFADAQKILGAVPLVKAAQYYAQKHPAGMSEKTVREVAAEFVAIKRGLKLHKRYLYLISHLLLPSETGKKKKNPNFRSLSEVFHCNIGSVEEAELTLFLDGLKRSPTCRNNLVVILLEFFKFAKKKRYLPDDWSASDCLKKRPLPDSEITLYTPAEVLGLLSGIEDKRVMVVLAICAFAGTRVAEALRLDWAQMGVNDGKSIRVSGSISKTGRVRHVPLTKNLKAWLAPHWKPSGPIWTASYDRFLAARLEQVKKIPNFKFKYNALRHSYISYRVAQCENLEVVAYHAGNSPKIIKRHYLEHVTAKEAAQWFSVMPPKEVESGKISRPNFQQKKKQAQTPPSTAIAIQAGPAAPS